VRALRTFSGRSMRLSVGKVTKRAYRLNIRKGLLK